MTRAVGTLVLAGGLLAVAMVLALAIGAVHEPVHVVLDVVTRRIGLSHTEVSAVDDQIVWQLRLPRVIGAAATGAGLAVCGAVLQTLTRNDLADPYLLGISDGASVGAVLVLVLGVEVAGLAGTTALALAAFAGAMAAVLLVLVLAAGRGSTLPPARTVLAGVAVGQVCGAFTSFIVLVLGDQSAARGVLEWTLGSVAGVRWPQACLLLGVGLAGTVLTVVFARDLDAFAFGETTARSLGVPVERVRWLLIALCALLTGCLVAYTGVIGFVGLVVPHVVRLLAGPRHRLLIPAAALAGGALLVASDLLARTVLPDQEIPVGIVTAGLGAPFFAWLLWRSGRTGRTVGAGAAS